MDGLIRRVPVGGNMGIGGSNRQAGGGLPITANLFAHYQFNTGITITGAGVSQWDDQSANNYHLKQTTDSFRPAHSAGIITFDGIDNRLVTDAFSSTSQPLTYYLLLKQVSWTSDDGILDGIAVSTRVVLYQLDTSGHLAMWAGTANANKQDFGIGTEFVCTAAFNAQASGSYSEKNNDGPFNNGANAGTNSITGLTVGSFYDASNFANIEIREIVVYEALHSDADQLTMYNYLNAL